MSQLDDFLAEEQQTGQLPVPAPPEPRLTPKVAATNELDAFIQAEVQTNPTLLDDDAPILAPTPIVNIAPGVAQFTRDPTEGGIEKFFRRGVSEVTRAVGSLGRLPELGVKAMQAISPMSIAEKLAGEGGIPGWSNIPPLEMVPGYKSKMETLFDVGEEFEKSVDALAPMSREEQAAYAQQYPVGETVSSALGQLTSLYLTPTTTLKLGSSLTLGAKEQSEDVAMVERLTGKKVDAEAKATAELFGAATGATDIIPYWHAMRGILRKMPDEVHTKFVQRMEKWWRAQAVGARYAAENVSVALSEAMQEAFQGWGQDLTARDWVGYDPERDPLETLDENLKGGYGAGTVFDAALKLIHGRGLRTLRAEDRAYALRQSAEAARQEAAAKAKTLGEEPTLTPELAEQRVEHLREQEKKSNAELSLETALLSEHQHSMALSPRPEIFERQASRSTEHFEKVKGKVTQKQISDFLNINDIGAGEKALAVEVFNKYGEVSGPEFATLLQSQLFPLAANEVAYGLERRGDQASQRILHGIGAVTRPGAVDPEQAWARMWETPFAMTGGLERPDFQVPLAREGERGGSRQWKRDVLFRFSHTRGFTLVDGVQNIIEVQQGLHPAAPGSEAGTRSLSTVLNIPTERETTPGQLAIRRKVLEDSWWKFTLRNEMARLADKNHRKFRIVMPQDVRVVHEDNPKAVQLLNEIKTMGFKVVDSENGVQLRNRDGSQVQLTDEMQLDPNSAFNKLMQLSRYGMPVTETVVGQYEKMHKWLKENFQTREVWWLPTTNQFVDVNAAAGIDGNLDAMLPTGSRKWLEVVVPPELANRQIPFGSELKGKPRQVETPYHKHEQAVQGVIQRLLDGNSYEMQVFKTDKLRKEAQKLREELRLAEKEQRKTVRYYAIKDAIKQLEFQVRSKEAGARRLNNILNWGGKGRPPGTPGFGEIGPDKLEKDRINWGLENFGTLMDLAYRNKHIKPLQDIAQNLWFKHADMMRHVHKSVETVKALDGLSSKQRAVLFKVMMQSVIDSRESGMRYLDSALVKELQTAGAKPKTIEVYLRVRKDFSDAVDTLRGALLSNLQNNMKREGKWDALLNAPQEAHASAYLQRAQEIDDNLNRWKETEYFPFLRFGEWKVRVVAKGAVVKDNNTFLDGDTVEYMQFPTEAEARAAVRELQDIYASQDVSLEVGKQVQSPFAVSTGVPEGFMAQLTQKLNLTEDQKHRLFELSAKTAPSKSFIQRYLRKKLTSGYSQDGIRAYADYFYSFASYVSNLKYDHLVDLGRAELRASVDKFKGERVVDTTKRDRIVQFIEYHVDRLRANQNEFATLRQIGTFWYLGFVPKTVFVNTLQVPMILYPYLRARYGEKAAGKIGDAYGGQIGNAILSSMKRLQKVQGKTPLNPDPGLDDILTLLYESGKLNQSFLTELAAATSEDRIKAFSLGRARRYWHETVSLSMLPFQKFEELNRRVTVEAIYRLEMDLKHPGKSWEKLTPQERRRVRDAVIEGLDKTMFEYGRWNRAKFQQGWKSPIFLFYGYMQGLLSFLANDPGNRRAMLLLLLIGGLEGLPFFGNLLDVLDTLLAKAPQKFKELWADTVESAGVSPQSAVVPDLRGQLRDFIMQMTEGNTAVRDLIMNGASKRYGLGPLHALRAFDVNVPEIDISGSLSVGRLIPGTDKIRQAVIHKDGGAAWEGVMEAVAGPIGAAASGVTQAMLNNDIDKWKQLEKGLPTFAKGISQAVRRETYGGETRNVNDVVIPTTTPENVATAMSFRPTNVAQEQTVQWQTYERKLYFAGWRKAIFNDIERFVRLNAVKAEDGGELPPEIIKELERFNHHAPGGYKIGRDSIKRSLRDRLKSGATEVAVGVEEIRDLELLQEVERLVGRPPVQEQTGR